MAKPYPKAPKGLFVESRRAPVRSSALTQPSTQQQTKSSPYLTNLRSSIAESVERSPAGPILHPPSLATERSPFTPPGECYTPVTGTRSSVGREEGATDRITIRLASGVYAKVKPKWPVSKIIDGFCKLIGANKTGLSLTFRGCRLVGTRTIASVCLAQRSYFVAAD